MTAIASSSPGRCTAIPRLSRAYSRRVVSPTRAERKPGESAVACTVQNARTSNSEIASPACLSRIRVVAETTAPHSIEWGAVVSATTRMRDRHAGLAISEFDVLAFCTVQATADSPGFRSALVGETTRREYARLNLGIAVHLPGDELAMAVIRGADALPVEDFLATVHAQIQRS